ncbi:ROK family protein [Halobacillus fulvus]|nr:ROK family protein [Halobacillus fulvus]
MDAEVREMYGIGIDIGGTSTKGVLVDAHMESIQEVKVPTATHHGREAILGSLTEAIDALLKSCPEKPDYIGVGSAGRIDVSTGTVVYATDNLPGWQGLGLKKWLEDKYDVTTVVDNDANAALIGELFLEGPVALEQNTVMLTLGTGVGGANYFFGQIVRGAHHQSGEWGHVVLHPGGRPCNCGKLGCVEQYISGTALNRRVEELTDQPLKNGEDLFRHKDSNLLYKQVVEEFVEDLSTIIDNISISLDPDRIILGGGVVQSRSFWWPLLLDRLQQKEIKTFITPAVQENKAGMFGAAYLGSHLRTEGRRKHEAT